MDYLDLISKGESETLEFKKSTRLLREGIETICAFANHRGGYLLFGVSDKGQVLGQIVHRDYRQDIKSTVEIRPSAISCYNPAHLFGPTITIKRLKTHHPSRPGNKLIAKVFYLMGLFENWGGGTLKIISETINAGKPSPEFTFDGGMFRLLLFR